MNPDLEPIAEPGRLRVFVPTKLVNDSQTSGIHWGPRARRARQQIDATCLAILSVLRLNKMTVSAKPEAPKMVTLVAYHPPPAFDEPDGLAAACKHVRDGLVHAGLLRNDAPRDAHRWEYAQVLTRKARGVLVTVRLGGPGLATAPPSDSGQGEMAGPGTSGLSEPPSAS